MYDLIIVGGGPAALSADFYAQGKAINALTVFEELGGKVGWLQSLTGPEKDQYLPGNEVVQFLVSRLTQPGRAVLHDRVLAVSRGESVFRVAMQDHGVLESAALLIATGTTPLTLNVPGAKRFVDRGLGYSITTYAHLVAGLRVAVIGAAPRAIAGAAELTRSAARVYLIVPDPAGLERPIGERLRRYPTVEVFEGYEVTEVIGVDAIEELVIARGTQTRRVRVDRAFVDLGLVPHSEIVRGMVATDARGFIVVNTRHETTLPGLFAAGDVTTAPCEQVLAAIGAGAQAAMAAYDYLLAQWLAPGTPPGTA